jgi:hypothetical protein
VLTILLAATISVRQSTVLVASAPAIQSEGSVTYGSVLAIGFGIWLKLVVLAALTLLVATFARTQLFTTAIGFVVLVIGHLHFLAESAAIRGSAMSRGIARMALGIFPDFQVFDFSDAMRTGAAIPWREVGSVGLYGLGYTGAVCVAALISFRAREL